MIKFKCSSCDHQIAAPDKYAGKLVRCPKCKAATNVPASVENAAIQQPQVIKFRCPSCNQKIGIPPKYAGKRVKCAKCKNSLVVPQASPQSPPPAAAKDQTAVLKAGQEQLPKTDDIWVDMDELRLAVTNAPLVERQTEPNGVDYDSGDSDTARLPQSGSYPNSSRPKKNRLPIFIGAGCVLVLLLVGIVIWTVGSDSPSRETQITAIPPEAQEFAEDYIGLLSEGKIDQARELLSPDLQINLDETKLEKLVGQLGKIEIKHLDCAMTHFEKSTEGDRIYLNYNLRYDDSGQPNIISLIIVLDEELRVEGIGYREPFGDTISIGQSSYQELMDLILTAEFEKFGSIFIKYSRVISIVAFALGIIYTISLWIVFNKAGQPGWAAIVPYYSMWVLAEVAEKPGWVGILFCFCGLIPFVGSIVAFVLWAFIAIGVASAFDRGIGFGIGLTILPFVFYPILAFTND